MNAPRLTLCAIVRDEADRLPTFLSAAEGRWDELVAVDTGSEDDTPARLRAAGAKVLHATWEDDFSAARNEALRAATGEWILVLDADEHLSPAAWDAVRAVVDDPAAGAAMVPVRSQLTSGAVRQALQLRLFRRDGRVVYRHRVREDASEGVAEMLAARGLEVRRLGAAIEHDGLTGASLSKRGIRARDLRLLERALADDPLDLHAHYHRIEHARRWSDAPLLARATAEASRAVDEAPERLAQARCGGALLATLAQRLYGEQPRVAADWLVAFETRVLPSAERAYALGELDERAGELRAASAHYERALAIGTAGIDTFDLARAHLGLCRLALQRGDLPLALTHADAALVLDPLDAEALLVGIALRRSQGGRQAVEAFIEAHQTEHGASHALCLARAEEAFSRRDGAGARDALLPRVRDETTGPLVAKLAQAHLLAGDVEAAAPLAKRAMPEQPAAGLGVLVCNMARAQSTDLFLDLDPPSAERAMREWTNLLLDSDDFASIETFARMIPTVAELFPWLNDHAERRLHLRTQRAAVVNVGPSSGAAAAPGA